MFMDGLIYSSCAANLAEGVGDLWHITYTSTHFPLFHEHPPLMIWMLSAWFSLFGTSMIAAKAYSVALLILTALLMVAIWKRLGFSTATGWLPLLMLTLITDIPLCIHNNYLESTMTLFVLLAVWLPLRKGNILCHLLAGLSLAAATLTKGPVGLFPLVLPALCYLFGIHRTSLSKTIDHTIAMLLGTLLPLATLWLFSPAAKDYLTTYAHIQLIGGIHEPVTTRTHLIYVLFTHPLIPLLIAATILIYSAFRSTSPIKPTPTHLRTAGFLFALVLCGSLPMMISTKQRAFYLLTTYPLLALSVAVVAEPLARRLATYLQSRWFAITTALAIVLALVLDIAHYGRPGRDINKINDMDIIAAHITDGTTLAIPQPLLYDYSLHGYYYFYHRITLDPSHSHPYLLTNTTTADTTLYRLIDLPTAEWHLYQRIQ